MSQPQIEAGLIDLNTIELFDEPDLSLSQINPNGLSFKEELFVQLENIQSLLEPMDNTGQEVSSGLKVAAEEKKLAKKKRPRKRENILREICRLREEVASQKKKNEILRNKLNLRKEKNKKLELLFKKITSPNWFLCVCSVDDVTFLELYEV